MYGLSPRDRSVLVAAVLAAAATLAPADAAARYGLTLVDQTPHFSLAGEHAELIGSGHRVAWVAANNRCVDELLEGAIDAAGESCDAAVALAPAGLGLRASGRRALAGLHANLGVVHLLQGDAEAAQTSFRRALDLDGGHREARENLSRLLAEAR